MWLMELGRAPITVKTKSGSFSIGTGRFGVNDKEKWVIGLFKDSDERDPRDIHAIPTLNVATAVEIDAPSDLDHHRIGAADQLVEPFIWPAFEALHQLIEAYRDLKYLEARGTPRWVEQRGVFVPEMPFGTFRSLLFYVLTTGERTFVGVFAEGHSIMIAGGDALRDSLAQAVTRRIPLPRVVMVRAWERFFGGDFRSAIVDAATVIERCLATLLESKLTAARAGSKNRIASFIKDTSNRHLVTVVAGLFGIESEEWREGVAASLEMRHSLIHGQRRHASETDARTALDYAERLLILSETRDAEPPQDPPI
jgi:hypothetical protein